MKKINFKEFNLAKLKEMWKDKKGRAKIELAGYLLFFLFVIIFLRVSNHSISTVEKEQFGESFINEISDNYICDINITIDDDTYEYNLKVLGNNSSITRKSANEEKFYYLMNNKYYEMDNDGNYILTTIDEVFPYINYNYLNINSIRNFVSNGTKTDNIYKLKVSDIILNNTSEDEIIIKLDEDNKLIDIDYTNLFKIYNANANSILVTIKFNAIGSLMSLEE